MNEAEFREELDRLMSTAVEDGVRFDGSYPIRFSQDELPNYEVMITEISNTAD